MPLSCALFLLDWHQGCVCVFVCVCDLTSACSGDTGWHGGCPHRFTEWRTFWQLSASPLPLLLTLLIPLSFKSHPNPRTSCQTLPVLPCLPETRFRTRFLSFMRWVVSSRTAWGGIQNTYAKGGGGGGVGGGTGVLWASFLEGRFHGWSASANERSPGVTDSPPPRLPAPTLLSLSFFPRSPSCFASSHPHPPRMKIPLTYSAESSVSSKSTTWLSGYYIY